MPGSHSMLGMRLDYMEVEPFVRLFVARAAGAGEHEGEAPSIYCCVPDVHQCMLCHDDPAHRAIVNGADHVMSDSTVMQAARAWRHGVPRVETRLGLRMMLALCEEAERRGVGVGLVGGRDETALERLQAELRARFPRLDLAYAYAPPFRPLEADEEAAMLEGLARSGARLVFFGIGCPKQEQWMARYKGRIAGAMIGVGAAFDVLSGAVRPAPLWVHRAGLEWALRLAREPRRLWRRYMHAAPRFVWLLARERLREGRTPGAPSSPDAPGGTARPAR